MGVGDSPLDSTAKPNGGTPPTDRQPKQGTSDEALQGMLTQAMGEIVEPFKQVFSALDKRLGAMEQRLSGGDQSDGTSVTGTQQNHQGEQSPLDDLVADPKKFAQEAARDLLNKEVGPLFQTWAQDRVQSFRTTAKERFDSKVGPGSFDKFIASKFDEYVPNLPAAHQGSERHLNAVVNHIIGEQFDSIKEAQAEHTKAQEDTMRRQAASSVLPQGRPRPKGDQLEAYEKDFLESLAEEHGETIDPKEWVSYRDRGITEDDWADAFAKEGGDSK